jgi:hypothetical protein
MIYREVEVQLHSFLTSALDGKVVSFKSWSLYPEEKGPWHPVNMRAGQPHSWFKHSGEWGHLLSLP